MTHRGSSGANASLPVRARWTIGCVTICSIVGLQLGSAAIHVIIRSVSAGESGDRSTTLKSFVRRACHGAPPSGTQILVDTSRMTRPKLGSVSVPEIGDKRRAHLYTSAAMTNTPWSISGGIYTLSPSRSSFSRFAAGGTTPPRPDPWMISAGDTRGHRVARPKSPILSEPVEEMRMFAGLMSKWITPDEWMWLIPCESIDASL